MFDSSEKLKKYKNTSDIVKDFFETRLKMYEIRKKYQLETLQRDLLVLSNKAKYILGNLDGSIDLRGKKKDVITNMLKDMDFDTLPDDNEYKYLVKMPMDSVSKENSDKLINEKTVKEKDVEILKTTSIYDIWLGELAELKDAYCKYIIQRSKQSSTKKRKSKKLKLK
jgi:DNA topoisomerase-2